MAIANLVTRQIGTRPNNSRNSNTEPYPSSPLYSNKHCPMRPDSNEFRSLISLTWWSSIHWGPRKKEKMCLNTRDLDHHHNNNRAPTALMKHWNGKPEKLCSSVLACLVGQWYMHEYINFVSICLFVNAHTQKWYDHLVLGGQFVSLLNYCPSWPIQSETFDSSGLDRKTKRKGCTKLHVCTVLGFVTLVKRCTLQYYYYLLASVWSVSCVTSSNGWTHTENKRTKTKQGPTSNANECLVNCDHSPNGTASRRWCVRVCVQNKGAPFNWMHDARALAETF